MTDAGLHTDADYSDEQRLMLLPSQTQALELIAHMAVYSDMLVVVTGPDGSGKTTLAQELMTFHSDPEDTLLITADLMLGMPALLRRLGDLCQLRLPDDRAAAIQIIRDEARQWAADGRTVLLLVDQAEQLDADTLNDIAHFALLVDQGLAVVLFGRSGFEQALRGGPAQAPVHIQSLQPLNENEAQDLLQQVYSPGRALPLSHSELKFLWQKAAGWPGALLLQAGDYFLAASPAAATVPETAAPASAGRFPLTHILALTVLVMALLLSFLYRTEPEPEAVLPVQPVDVLRGIPLPEQPVGERSAAAEPDPFVSTISAPEAETPQEPLPEEPVAEVSISVPVVATEPDYNYTPPATPAPPASAAVLPAAEKPVAAPPAAAVVRPVPQTDAARLLAVSQGFVVQLFGSYKSDNADNFRQQWGKQIAARLYQYETRHNGKPWFVVVAGVYNSRPEAASAVNSWPSELRAQSPWIRDIRAVHPALQ